MDMSPDVILRAMLEPDIEAINIYIPSFDPTSDLIKAEIVEGFVEALVKGYKATMSEESLADKYQKAARSENSAFRDYAALTKSQS